MESNHPKDEYHQIIKENLKLKAELQLLKGKEKASSIFSRIASKFTTNVFIGKGLKRSVLRLFEELPDGKVSKVTLADVSTHLVWRLTRVGIFTLMLAFIPLCLLSIQTYILNTQNQLLAAQNDRLDQQINLEEGSRRSSLIFLMSNIMDKMGDELKASPKNILSDALIGRIVSLSQALRPYRYLENDVLIKQPLSPERGQLLISLTNSHLHESTYEKLFSKADFSYADLKNAKFDEDYMEGVELSFANLQGASFRNTDLEYANLIGANLQGAKFEETYMNGINFSDADLRNSLMANVKMTYATLKNTDLRYSEVSGDFRYAIFDGIRLDSIKMGFLDIEGVEIRDSKLMSFVDTNDVASIYTLPKANKDYLNENFKWQKRAIQKEDMSISSHYVLTRKKASTLSTMDNCLKKVVEIIKSANRVQQIERELMQKKESIAFIPEANPFGDDNLNITLDSVYLFRMITEAVNTPLAIGWIEFNPIQQTLKEFDLGDTTYLNFNKSLLNSLPLECSK